MKTVNSITHFSLSTLLSLGACQLFLSASPDDLIEAGHCEDNTDNDNNGKIDCQDEACAAEALCGLFSVCGDGVLQGSEECDDGNTVSLDGCDAGCLLEATFFVDCNASGINNGSTAAPFSSLQQAVDATSPGGVSRVIVSSSAGGVCQGGIFISEDRFMVYQARGEITVDVKSLKFEINAATAIFRGFTILGKVEDGTFGSSNPSAQLVQVANGAQLAILDSSLQNQGKADSAIALNVDGVGSRALLDRVLVSGNKGGGVVALNGAQLIVTNSLLLQNGDAGVSLFAAIQSEGSTFFAAHNTFFGNLIGEQSSVEDTGTADCREGGVGRLLNSVAAANEELAFSPSCTYEGNLVLGIDLGGSNQEGDPIFVDVNTENFHLQETSLGVDVALSVNVADFPFDPDSIFAPFVGALDLLGHDHDGTPRPLGVASDLGAFEDF
jgi:cysteine-rich repeat protein